MAGTTTSRLVRELLLNKLLPLPLPLPGTTTTEVDLITTILTLRLPQLIHTTGLIKATGTCRLLKMVLPLMTDIMAVVVDPLLLTVMVVVDMTVLLLLTIDTTLHLLSIEDPLLVTDLKPLPAEAHPATMRLPLLLLFLARSMLSLKS